MTQDIGMNPNKQNPISYIISIHLSQLQAQFGGMALASAIIRSKRKVPKTSNWLDIHISNLNITYGQDTVSNLYTSLYTLDNNKKAV